MDRVVVVRCKFPISKAEDTQSASSEPELRKTVRDLENEGLAFTLYLPPDRKCTLEEAIAFLNGQETQVPEPRVTAA